MTSQAISYETYEKDSYNITFGMIGGRNNRYNSPSHGKPSRPRKRTKHSPHGGTGHNNNHSNNDNNNDDNENNNTSHQGAEQNLQLIQSPHQQPGALQPAEGAYPCVYAAPYPYQYPPPPYPNYQQYHGGYHAPGYPAGPFVPHQGGGHGGYGFGNHGGGGHMKDVGLVGAAVGVASFGVFKLLRERRRYGRG